MKEVYLVQGKRTPQAKAGADLKDVPVPHLGVGLIRNILDETNIPHHIPGVIDEVIIGNTGNPPKYPNIGRVIALEADLHKKTSGYTVHRNCASGLEALAQAFVKIASERAQLILAGGVESMSQMPLIFSKELTEIFIKVMTAKTISQKLLVLKKFRLPHLAPIIAIEQGLTDPFCGLNMGQTAELLAREFNITRQEQDTYANDSHQKTIKAQNNSWFEEEIVPIIIAKKLDKLLTSDSGPRESSSVEKLAKLKPYFDRKSGTVTVGNSCPLTDGGSMFLLASADGVKKHNLDPIAKLHDFSFTGLEPERMGMGPLVAMDDLAKRCKSIVTFDQIDLFEINEAFAVQVIAVRKALKDKKMLNRFDLQNSFGEIPDEKLNVSGGAIALGHPVGSTGCRLVVTLAHALKRTKKRWGVASLCIGGGQGGACLIENLKL